MTGTKPMEDPTRSDVEQALERLQLLYAEQSRLMATVRSYVRKHGPISAHSLYADNRQTVKIAYRPDLVAEIVAGLGVPYEDLLGLMTTANINKLVKHSQFAEHIQAQLDMDEDGGEIVIYGKPSIEIRRKPPEEGKHNVVMPGEKPLTNGVEYEAEE